ncbi:unnamed protein product [Rotaria sp. Silwood1]|nr:unnamed protein product [Rotaria sp. Silwood1]
MASKSSSNVHILPFPIHGSTIECHGDDGIETTGDIAAPLHVSTAFVSGASESSGQVYSRLQTVTRARVEAVLGAVEGGQAITYSSGLSAATALIHCIKPRSMYVDAGYHGVRAAFKLWSERASVGNGKIEFLTLEQCKKLYEQRESQPRAGCSLWRPADKDEERALDLIWIESPYNPYESHPKIAASKKEPRFSFLLATDGQRHK